MLNDMSQTKVMITKDCSPFVLCKRTILETAIFLRVERREAHAIELEQYPKVPYHV